MCLCLSIADCTEANSFILFVFVVKCVNVCVVLLNCQHCQSVIAEGRVFCGFLMLQCDIPIM